MELCHCKGRIRGFVTLEKRLSGDGKEMGVLNIPSFTFVMSSFSVVEQKNLNCVSAVSV